MLNDLRYALRGFLRTPTFTIVAILTLALGIGANTAIFSVVNGVLFRPLPYANPSSIVQVWTTGRSESRGSHAAADFLDYQRSNRTFNRLAGYREDALTVVTPSQGPVRVHGTLVTLDYFDVFGMSASIGRTFSAASDSGTTEPRAVLSHDLWVRQLASDPLVVNRLLRINGVPHLILGVMPAAFDYPEGSKAWVLSPKPVPLPPIDVEGELLEDRDVHYFQAVGRLKPGISAEQARQDLTTIAADQGRQRPQSNAGRGIAIQPLYEKIVGDVRQALFVLLGAVGVVLIIACANIASLLLARGAGRQRELAIRAAIGAARGRLLRQLITESLVIGAAGGLVGLLAGRWAISLLVTMLPEGIPRVDQIGLDTRVAAVGVVASFASALVFGLVPALQASRAEASIVLHDADRGSSAGRRRTRTRSALVVAEIALTLVLLVSAGLLANSFIRLEHVAPGFQVEHVALVMLPLPQAKYPDGKRQTAFYQRVLETIQTRPQIQSAAILFPNPIEGTSANGSFTLEGHPVPAHSDKPSTAIASVSDDYFRTLGIPLIKGRMFSSADRDPAPATAIVNATFVRQHLDGADALGKRLRFGDSGDDWITIVGVVGDSRNVGLHQPPTPLLYLPYHRFPLAFMNIAVRSAAGTGAVASLLREAVKGVDPDMPVDDISEMSQVLEASVAEPRFRTLLISAFALMAVVLASVGVYGLMSFSVQQRTREIGIRVALGARPRQVMLSVLREGMTLAAVGVGLGLAGALAATRVLSSFLFGVGAGDPLTFSAVAVLLLMVALLASYVPSRRALRVDPITALRAE